MIYPKIQKHFLLLFFSIVLFSITTSSSLAQPDNWISKTKMPTGPWGKLRNGMALKCLVIRISPGYLALRERTTFKRPGC